ncbi:hypothetical protein [Jiella sonneratiae]|uniref:Copper chaperone PCu(A)C n=1 Tax=Jiella sonneratiae TaxID=2816856 RepID=A0ABS3J9V9_9HYPH|nr:hypothetical protein [Jiella sonneratiae]MBO0905920.1 hypothetical protein [Jiella sonneratiae]
MPQSRAARRPRALRSPRFRLAGLLAAAALVAASAAPAGAETTDKSGERLAAGGDEAAASVVATVEHDAVVRIAAPLAPTRLSLVLSPVTVEPDTRAFMDVYLQPAEAAGNTAAGPDPALPDTAGPSARADSPDSAARLSGDNASRLAGTVAFTEANAPGEEEYFVVNVPPGMRFDGGAAIVTLVLSGGDLGKAAVEIRKANLLK